MLPIHRDGQYFGVKLSMIKHPVFLVPVGIFFLFSLQAKEESLSPDDLAFRVGSITVTKYIYQREFDKAFLDDGSSINDTDKEKWLDEWINRMKIVNMAIKEGYSNKPEIRNAVAIMSRYILISGQNSPYARIVLDPLINSEKSRSESSTSFDLHRLRSKKLAEIKLLMAQQLSLKLDPAGEKFVLKNLDSLLKILEHPNFGKALGRILFKYSLGNSTEAQEITIEDFFSQYNTRVMKSPISNSEGLLSEISAFLVENILHEQAIEMALNEDQRFRLEAENFERNVIYEIYSKRDLAQYPTENDLREYFRMNQQKYMRITSVALWIAKSEDKSSLGSLRRKVLHMKTLHPQPEQFIKYFEEKSKEFGFELSIANRDSDHRSGILPANAFVAPIGWMPPIEENDGVHHLLVKRENVEQKIPSFDLARDAVKKDLLAIEYRMRRNNDLLAIGKQFHVFFGKGFLPESNLPIAR